ncbi:hypothetical protein R1sor_006206 [Riccia sorocarpa]|uniref:tRNA pseudouridine(55) synthase n=1 Tax=Riccia sorocarpa TaxID=122646 RepID=A0ABD3HR36_9MARC
MGFPDALQELLPRLPVDVVLELLRQEVCLRCIFRFLNVRDAVYSVDLPTTAEVYSKLLTSRNYREEDHKRFKSSELDRSLPGEATCLVCLGVLQHLHPAVGAESQADGAHKYENNAISCILKAFRDRGHSVEGTFCLEVSVTALVLLRERGLWCFLKDHFKEEALFSGEDVNDHIVSIKEAVKWSLLEGLENSLSAKFDATATLRIALVFKHPGCPADAKFLTAASAGGDSKRKRHGQQESESQGFAAVVAARGVSEAGETLAAVQRCLASMNNELFMESYQCPPSKVNSPCEITAVTWRNPVFVGGRYLKYSRNVSQSRWVIEEERMGEASVQEIIGDVVMPYYNADTYKFHAAGREDIDVRMLGTGRPFIIELLNARRIPSAEEIQKAELDINGQKEGWVKVKGLRRVGVEVCSLMRQGEIEKQKEYVAVVWLDRPVTQADFERLSNLKELEIQQKTPVRVLHRRSPLIRPRTIHWMRCEPLKGSDNYFLLHLCTQAGTYIKEFVHGDLGRTYPNVGSLLGCAADILQLDVVDVKMEFE